MALTALERQTAGIFGPSKLRKAGFSDEAAKTIAGNIEFLDLLDSLDEQADVLKVSGDDAGRIAARSQGNKDLKGFINKDPGLVAGLNAKLEKDPNLKVRILELNEKSPETLNKIIPNLLSDPTHARTIIAGARKEAGLSKSEPVETVASTTKPAAGHHPIPDRPRTSGVDATHVAPSEREKILERTGKYDLKSADIIKTLLAKDEKGNEVYPGAAALMEKMNENDEISAMISGGNAKPGTKAAQDAALKRLEMLDGVKKVADDNKNVFADTLRFMKTYPQFANNALSSFAENPAASLAMASRAMGFIDTIKTFLGAIGVDEHKVDRFVNKLGSSKLAQNLMNLRNSGESPANPANGVGDTDLASAARPGGTTYVRNMDTGKTVGIKSDADAKAKLPAEQAELLAKAPPPMPKDPEPPKPTDDRTIPDPLRSMT